MLYAGIDLHKHSIRVCVRDQRLSVLKAKTLACGQPDAIRDFFAELGAFPTYGMAPHDCHLVEGGRTLVITNGGGPVDSPFLPSVTFVDVASRALLEKHEVLDRNRNMGHVALTDNREFAVVSAPR